MSSTTNTPSFQLNKFWTCIKDVYTDEWFGDGWYDGADSPPMEKALKILFNIIGMGLGMKKKDRELFAEAMTAHETVVAGMVNFFRKGSSATWKDAWDAINPFVGAIVGITEKLGVKIAKRAFLPFTIVSIVYDWLSPAIPCLLPDPKVPDTEPAVNAASPLVIDLNADGVGSYKLKNGVYFDLDNNGFKEKTAWTHYQDGLLALDLNGNGTIDNGAELFGNHTQLANGSLAANGFEALAQYDDNKDGVINNKDKIWKNLLVWQDKVNDGVSQTDELTKIAKIGITEIDLGYKNSIFNAVNDTIFVFQAA